MPVDAGAIFMLAYTFRHVVYASVEMAAGIDGRALACTLFFRV